MHKLISIAMIVMLTGTVKRGFLSRCDHYVNAATAADAFMLDQARMEDGLLLGIKAIWRKQYKLPLLRIYHRIP